MKRLQVLLQGTLVLALCLALPTGSFANISNVASVTYQDAASNNYSGTSNGGVPVVIVTPPVVTAPASLTLDVGVAMTAVQVSATNALAEFVALLYALPSGITISNSGLISGTPAAGSSGSYSVTLTAANSAGPGTAAFSITVRGSASIALTKTADVSHAVSGNTVTFTISYSNSGAGPASNVVITDVIPAGSTLVTGSITGAGSYASGTQTITWTIPSVNAGANGSVTFKVTVN